jgi:hypothetical protein
MVPVACEHVAALATHPALDHASRHISIFRVYAASVFRVRRLKPGPPTSILPMPGAYAKEPVA